MLKKVDVADVRDDQGRLRGRLAGGVHDLRPRRDGVGYSTSGGFVDDIADQLDAFKEQIISGEIVVPTAP